jgi:hypothetical protein
MGLRSRSSLVRFVRVVDWARAMAPSWEGGAVGRRSQVLELGHRRRLCDGSEDFRTAVGLSKLQAGQICQIVFREVGHVCGDEGCLSWTNRSWFPSKMSSMRWGDIGMRSLRVEIVCRSTQGREIASSLREERVERGAEPSTCHPNGHRLSSNGSDCST